MLESEKNLVTAVTENQIAKLRVEQVTVKQLSGVKNKEFDDKGNLRGCMLYLQNKIRYGMVTLIPKFEESDDRSKFRNAVEWEKSGTLRSIYLEKQQEIDTPIGKMKAEFLTFYRSGKLHRIFPRYGQISGYWTEEEEGKLLEPMNIRTIGGTVYGKISNLCFYESGQLRSITIWPGEKIKIYMGETEYPVRYGISFFETGEVESIEPMVPCMVKTEVGTVLAFDPEAIGINGDRNSIRFDRNGNAIGWKTIQTGIDAHALDGSVLRFDPQWTQNPLNPEQRILLPLTVDITLSEVRIACERHQYGVLKRELFHINTRPFLTDRADYQCGDCGSCNGCGQSYE